MSGIVQVMDTLLEELSPRRNLLLSHVEGIKMDKEASLKSQQEALLHTAEALNSGGEFAEGLVESASVVEVALSRPAVMDRLLSLLSTPVELTLYEDSVVNFIGDGRQEARHAIQDCGLVSSLQTSPQKSLLSVNGEPGPFTELREMDLQISAFLNNGSPVTKDGDNFTSSLTINDQPQDAPAIVDLENGTYGLKFTPRLKGRCLVRGMLGEHEIKGSPLEVLFND